jgi:hypothetical protein
VAKGAVQRTAARSLNGPEGIYPFQQFMASKSSGFAHQLMSDFDHMGEQ